MTRVASVSAAILASLALAFTTAAYPDGTPASTNVEVSSHPSLASTGPSPSDVLERERATYLRHLSFLANPAMEGRAPGTNGNRVAANYIEQHFTSLGFTPAFTTKDAAGNATPNVNFRQVFEARPSERPGDSIRLQSQAASFTAADGTSTNLAGGVDFNVLGHSATGEITGPLVFVGYGIESEGRKYRSIPEGTDLKGKVAVVFRLEPMNEEGKSKWADSGWSFQAGLELKLNTVAAAGASGIILVNAPGADHAQAKTLGDISLGSRRHQKVPVVMLSNDAGERLVKAADSEGRGLAALRTLADNLAEGESGVLDLPNATVSLKAEVDRIPLMTDNVGAILPGVGDLAGEFIVLGAHYDHVGYGYFSSRGGADARGKIHAGADDNASGTSGLLLTAEKLATAYKSMPADAPRRSILFLAFSAEESGLEGSKFYVKNAIDEQSKHAFMINMDMIGRMRDARLDLQGTSTGEGLVDWLKPYLEQSGIDVVPTPGGSGPSDHASFYAWGVPVLFTFTRTHEQYHTPEDVIATINTEGATRIADLVSRLSFGLATRAEKFTYVGMGKADSNDTASAGPARGTRVRFGIAPGDYSGAEKGVLVGSVFPDTPAAKGGLQKDDLMTHWNGKELADVESWMPMLSDAKPGDQVIITYKRKVGDEWQEMTTTVELTARQRPAAQ